ncbi:DNA phosphorothioation-dependent restriction protein DptF [Flammeovirga agarivorans]|uniref:DNA phosphorothioation-dependent restriction protein DptF n=1 Tax=Flammeovirga agarivorans TaxID=2726742 RepID=A0A7X8SKI8_9BACT|nr:DNA phosphorothioation-dependent restriction protein DptF [Flammeovirga agarivorans]NLR91918.1 DNA phosphorothioation-dependent restriction protein DptF [Flammeovirga agarivorans]
MSIQNNTFKSILDTLSISSKEAVVDGNKNSLEYDPIKKYLHVKRFVEEVLTELVLQSFETPFSQLILISGNVGDGKSHLLARLHELYPEQLKEFKIKNDATESQSVDKSWKQELDEFLKDFTDQALEEKESINRKAILAINLGTLTNFLEDYQKDDKYNKLQKFVEEYNLLNSSFQEVNIPESSPFQYINLADYQLFSIRENPDEIKSKVISELLQKITSKSNDNPFYQAFKNDYDNNENKYKDPIYYNYNFISDKKVQDIITKVILNAIISDKLIVPVRQLLNFIFQLIVPTNLASKNKNQIARSIKRYDIRAYITSLTPFLIFNNEDAFIFKSIKYFDPCRNRDSELDQHIFKLSNKEQIESVFKDNELILPEFIKELIHKNSEKLGYKETRAIIRLFTRLNYFRKWEPKQVVKDYIIMLYYSYINPQNPKARKIIKNILIGIYNWNGTSNNNTHINIEIGKKQNEYKISQELKIIPHLIKNGCLEKDDELHRFSLSLKLAFKANRAEIFETVIDYNLFELLYKIGQGYRPNREDKQRHLSFELFIRHISRDAGRMKDLTFQQISGKSKERFKLGYTEGLGYEFSKED